MIKLDKGKVHVQGSLSDIIAETACLIGYMHMYHGDEVIQAIVDAAQMWEAMKKEEKE